MTNNNGNTYPLSSPNDSYSLWNDMVEACRNRNLDPRAITVPEAYRSEREAAQRRRIINDLLVKGWEPSVIKNLCPEGKLNRMFIWRSKI